jgi:hypothetical protein
MTCATTFRGRWIPLLAFGVLACVPVQSNTRVERGPLLRTFSRTAVLTGGARGTVEADWPILRVSLEGFDLCRGELVEEYAEEHTTEHVSPAAGPAFSLGITGVLGGAGLFTSSFFVSDAPNVAVVDAAGRYGASPRQQVRGWSIVALAAGIPAVVVGVVSMLSSGEESETRRVEQLASQRDSECHPRPLLGPVELKDADGLEAARAVSTDGTVEFALADLRATPEKLSFFGRDIELDEASLRLLDAFAACRELRPAQEGLAQSMDDRTLVEHARTLQRCRRVRGLELKPDVDAVEAELTSRREAGAPGTLGVDPVASSWEEAVALWSPRLRFESGGTDLGLLDAPDALEGKGVILKGVVSSVVSATVGALQVGEREVLLFLPPRRGWAGEFGEGVRIEVVAVGAGTDALRGDRLLPLFRAVWLRQAY